MVGTCHGIPTSLLVLVAHPPNAEPKVWASIRSCVPGERRLLVGPIREVVGTKITKMSGFIEEIASRLSAAVAM
jgi:hypothetical protein